MLYTGQRTSVPSTRYGWMLDVIEATGWTLEELRTQPMDLIEELHIRLSKRAKAEQERLHGGQ